MANRDEFINSLEREIAREKKKTRIWTIVEIVGALVLIGGFILLGSKSKKFFDDAALKTAELASARDSLDEIQVSLDKQTQQLEAKKATMEQALQFIQDEQLEEAEKLLGIDLEPKKSQLFVNDGILVCNQLFQSCNSVRSGSVNAWAYINSPGSNRIEIQWTYPDGNIRKRTLDLGFNIDKGYRIYDTKNLRPGQHKVEILKDGQPLENGSREFVVD